MAASRKKLEQRLDAVSSLAKADANEETRAALALALADANNLIAGAAARIVRKHDLAELAPALVKCFHAFMDRPNDADNHCEARTAAVIALNQFHYEDASLYRRAIHHIQHEPVWSIPGYVDAAGELRGECLIGLARSGDDDLLMYVVDALVDPEPQPRHAAVRVLGALPGEEADALLRLKMLTGDKEPSVLAGCLATLASRDPERHLDFIARYLESNDSYMMEAAALAIGEIRTHEAFALLKQRYEQAAEPMIKKSLILPLALTRQDAATEMLLDILASEHPHVAAGVLRAASVFAPDSTTRERIAKIVRQRDNEVLNTSWQQETGAPAD